LRGECVVAPDEFQVDGRHPRGSPMLDGGSEFLTVATEIEIGVTPAVELRRTAQGLAGSSKQTSHTSPISPPSWDAGARLYRSCHDSCG